MSARISKQEMKKDTFVSAMLRGWEYVRLHERMIFLALAAVVLVIALSAWGAYSRRQSRERAGTMFSDALMTFRGGDLKAAEELFVGVVKEYGGTKEGAYAEYFVGKCAFESGRSREAVEAFDRYLARSGAHPFFHDAAMEGKAVALSNAERYQEAADTYIELAGELKTNAFMKGTYLRRAAHCLRLADEPERAIAVLTQLLETASGVERRDIEIEIEILKS